MYDLKIKMNTVRFTQREKLGAIVNFAGRVYGAPQSNTRGEFTRD